MFGEKRPSSVTEVPGEGREKVKKDLQSSTSTETAPKGVRDFVESTRTRLGDYRRRGTAYIEEQRPIAEHRLLRVWVVITLVLCVIAILVMLGIRQWDPLATTKATDMQTLEIFFSVFGLMYAIIVGLLIVEAHRRLRELSSAIESELNAIADIHDCLEYFDDSGQNLSVKEKITDSLCAYVKSMEKDLQRMKDTAGRFKIPRFRDRGIRNLILYVDKLATKDKNDEHALGAMVSKICELTTSRTNRLESGEQCLPSGFYLLILFMSVIIVVGTLLLNVAGVWTHGLIIFATTIALAALFLLLYDMDRPFIGSWTISTESLDHLREKITHKL